MNSAQPCINTASPLLQDLDETLAERLWGLTEMFPESVRNVVSSVFSKTVTLSKIGFQFGRSAVWIAASSATILALPVIFESERAQQQEQQIQQQRQVFCRMTFPLALVLNDYSLALVMGRSVPVCNNDWASKFCLKIHSQNAVSRMHDEKIWAKDCISLSILRQYAFPLEMERHAFTEQNFSVKEGTENT